MSAAEQLRALIEACDDVKALVRLEELQRGVWLYLIETPFTTFPRYVVGRTDVGNEEPVVMLKCGRLDSAEAEYAKWREIYGRADS
jgi:hypothetical protein